MKYGVFGGTFDPFTIAHYAIVKEILRRKLVDKIIILPTCVNWYREDKKEWLTYDQKYKVIRSCFNDKDVVEAPKDSNRQTLSIEEYEYHEGRIIIDCHEIDPSLNKNIESADYIENRKYFNELSDVINRYGVNNEYFTIVGSDSYRNFEEWSKHKAILGMSKLIVIDGRDEKDLPNDTKYRPGVYEVLDIDHKLSYVSASKTREKYQIQDTGKYGVKEYISELINQVKKYDESELPIKKPLLHTPIFDVIEREDKGYGFKPIAVKAPDWVAICVEKNGKYLLTAQLRYGTMTVVQEFPCGCVEKDETPVVAASRELSEETGYVVDPNDLTYLGKVATNPGFMTNFMHYFYVNLDNVKYQKDEPHLDEHEKLVSYWKDIDLFEETDFYYSEIKPVFVVGMLHLLHEKNIRSWRF